MKRTKNQNPFLFDPAQAVELVGRLGPRQAEVARLIALGFSHKEIANQLGLSVKTVSVHSDHVRKKFNGNAIARVWFCAKTLGKLTAEPTT